MIEMISKKSVLSRINEIIVDEKGREVKMSEMFEDAQLDSLGTMITLITIDSEFNIFDHEDPDNALEQLDIPNLSIRDLVIKCILFNTNTSEVQKTEGPT